MATSIDRYLNQIRTAVYGKQVRSAIADGIEECYNRDVQDNPLVVRRDVLADEFDATQNYTKGNLVFYEGDIYVFTADHPAGAWNTSNPDAVIITLADAFSNAIDDAKDELSDDIGDISDRLDVIKQDGIMGENVNRYAACSVAVSTPAKTANIANGTIDNLVTGLKVSVNFTSGANTADNPTLNINGKGAKPIFHNGTQITTGAKKALLAGVCDFIYDGTRWHLVGNFVDTDLSDVTGRLDAIQNDVDDHTEAIEELQGQLADLLYKAIVFNSLSISPSSALMGSTVSSVTISWSLSKVPKTLKLNETNVSSDKLVQSGNIVQSGTWTTNITHTMAATDERDTSVSRSVTLSFMNNVYYGVADLNNSPNSSFITGLTSEMRSSKKPSITINAGANKYVYYAQPTRLGTCSFAVGGFSGGFESPSTVSVTNSAGYTENYYVYRSTNHSLGSTTITIS